MHLVSRPGQGTCVELYLPCLQGEGKEVVSTVEPMTSVEGTGYTILVVEDEPAVRYLVSEVLHQAGFVVHEASDSPSALGVLRSGAPLDLLVTDVGLPGLSGRDLADKALALRPDLPVLFMTGYAESAISSGFLKPGMEMLTKPFTLNSLLRKVGSMLKVDGLTLPADGLPRR